MDLPVLSIIIPCYNEEENIEIAAEKLLNLLENMVQNNLVSEKSFLFFINDGSSDNTRKNIEKYYNLYPQKIKGINFSKNFGNQAAILAGIYESIKYDIDCCITIDADLQQDETKICEFVEKFKNGADIVLGIRNNRNTDGILKKLPALTFYKIMKFFGVTLEINHSEYRLISRKAANVLLKYNETNLFLRGIIQNIGFKKDYVYFDVKERQKGKSKFSTLSLISLALNGITSFSTVPLRMVSIIGFIMALSSFLTGIYAIIDKYTGTDIVPGWATIVVLIGFFSGIQILCLGVIAEYLGQLFAEVKSRPRYIIESKFD